MSETMIPLGQANGVISAIDRILKSGQKAIVKAGDYGISVEVASASKRNAPEQVQEPDNVEKHRELCEGLNRLYAAKNADYGDGFHKRYVDWEERVKRLYDRNGGGLLSASIRIRDKADRFENLIASDNPNVKDESIRDTLIDLANYALMTVMEIDRNAK